MSLSRWTSAKLTFERLAKERPVITLVFYRFLEVEEDMSSIPNCVYIKSTTLSEASCSGICLSPPSIYVYTKLSGLFWIGLKCNGRRLCASSSLPVCALRARSIGYQERNVGKTQSCWWGRIFQTCSCHSIGVCILLFPWGVRYFVFRMKQSSGSLGKWA